MAITNKECAIFVSSCDAFKDVWQAFFTLFFRYWPDCPFSVYLISNYKIYHDSRVKTIAVGEDKKWATNLRTAMKKYWYPYIIYLQEDYLFKSSVNTKRIISSLFDIKKEKAACIRLYPAPGPDRPHKQHKDLGLVDKSARYRFSTQATLWNSEILYNLLKDGESGWDMELGNGQDRSDAVEEPFLSITRSRILQRNNNPAINYFCTAIKKGRWYYDAIKLCDKEGINIDKNMRPIESKKRYYWRKLCYFPIIGKFVTLPLRLIRKIKKCIYGL